MTIGLAQHSDIEFVGVVLLQSDVDASLVDKCLATLNSLAVHVAQHLQTVFRFAHQGSQGHGDGQSYHPCAGNAYAHSILQHVGAKPYMYLLGRATQKLSGFGHAEGDGGGFGASYGGHHLMLDKSDDRFFLLLCHHRLYI